jgi:hypothetical protein
MIIHQRKAGRLYRSSARVTYTPTQHSVSQEKYNLLIMLCKQESTDCRHISSSFGTPRRVTCVYKFIGERRIMSYQSKTLPVISFRLKEEHHQMLLKEANQRMLTLSEMVRLIVEQRIESGGRQHEERIVHIESMLQELAKGIKKIQYHATRASLSTIAEYRKAHGDKEAEQIAKAIMEEVARYSQYLKESGKEV